MKNEILEVTEGLKSIIANELPNDKSSMKQFISNLDERFPECPKTIRTVFELAYQNKFNEKFVW